MGHGWEVSGRWTGDEWAMSGRDEWEMSGRDEWEMSGR